MYSKIEINYKKICLLENSVCSLIDKSINKQISLAVCLVINCNRSRMVDDLEILKKSEKILIFGIGEYRYFSLNETDTDTSIVSWASAIPIPILVSLAGPQRYRYRYQYRYLDLSDTDTDTWYRRPKYRSSIPIPIVSPISGWIHIKTLSNREEVFVLAL